VKTSTWEFGNSDQNFKRIAWICILFYFAVALSINLLTDRTVEKPDYTRLSPRITKLMIEAAKPLPPPPVVEAKKEEPKVEEKPKEAKKEETKPETPKEKPPEVAKQEGPSPEEIQAQQEAQRKKNLEVAMNSGLLKLLKQSDTKNEQENLPDAKLKKVFSSIKGLNQAPKVPAGGSLQSSPTATAGIDDIVAKLEKSIKASNAAGGNSAAAGSGGIIVGNIQADPGQSSLAERKTTAVESPFQIKGFEEGKSARNYESIAQVVDTYKGGISFLYNKALRENPALRGIVTVEFIIAASGDVTDCRVVSSSMKNPAFEEALIKRVLQWKFPPISAGDVTITYPIVFSVAG